MKQFCEGDRVERTTSGWCNIQQGMQGEVKEVLDFGKKLRVLFDTYLSSRGDGTVIVLAKTMGHVNRRPMTGGTVTGRVNSTTPQPQRVFLDTMRLPKTWKTKSVDCVDLSVPFHKQIPARVPDYAHFEERADCDDIEGFVGEDMSFVDQEDAADAFEASVANPAPQRPSMRALLRPALPYTAFERALMVRSFDMGDERGNALAKAMFFALQPSTINGR